MIFHANSLRLNSNDKTLELSNGEKLDVSRNPHFFPQGEEELAYVREKEKIKREIEASPLGELGYQFGEKGLIGGLKDLESYLTQSGDPYLRSKRARREISQEITETSPHISMCSSGFSYLLIIMMIFTIIRLNKYTFWRALKSFRRISRKIFDFSIGE